MDTEIRPSFDLFRETVIGTIDSVNPIDFKASLDIKTPQNTSVYFNNISTFPKINSIILIPNEVGAVVGIITWIGIEHSQYPKRSGLKDFDLIDLPFPLRRISISPLGTLKYDAKDKPCFERGIYSFPSVGDSIVLPSEDQLKSIIQNRDKETFVEIGTSLQFANAPVKINPDTLFGRHLAILGNTGSGKSCSVAGIVRWSLEEAKKHIDNSVIQRQIETALTSEERVPITELLTIHENPNARFIILDPNGEYTKSFDDLCDVKRFKVLVEGEQNDGFSKLVVPGWMWNSYEWCSLTQASVRTQRPLLQRALRELKSGQSETDNIEINMKYFYTSFLIEFRNTLQRGAPAYSTFPGKNDFGKRLKRFVVDVEHDIDNAEDDIKNKLQSVKDTIDGIIAQNDGSYIDRNTQRQVENYDPFNRTQVQDIISSLTELVSLFGNEETYIGPNEDTPLYFKLDDFTEHLNRLAQEQGVEQYIDLFIMRIKSLINNARIASVINDNTGLSMSSWLSDYIGRSSTNSISVIDFSLVPTDIIHITIAITARIIFEAIQRYKRINSKPLPTCLVLEEAHTFIKKHESFSEEINASVLCAQSFEKIAREGRKFGLGLVLSSQRPSELSSTILSQCNTFLLHRIVNDKDQELVRRLVPDTYRGLLDELSILPTRNAILLGAASPIPILVQMRDLPYEQRPDSADPDFWKVWTRKSDRDIDWNRVVEDWTHQGTNQPQ